MKKILLAAVSGLVMLSLTAGADNITINDTLGTAGNGRGGENGEVEPNCVNAQIWDMEAFLFNPTTKKLQMQGGFDMLNGVSASPSQKFYAGDVFIDVNGDAVWGSRLGTIPPNGGNVYATMSNAGYNWDYVIVFDRAGTALEGGSLTGGYKVYSISGETGVEVYFDQNTGANPFRYYSGGSEIASVTSGLTQTFFDDPVGGEGRHYVLGNIDLTLLPGNTEAGPMTFHFAEGCGNDLLMGHVPDAGTTSMLLGMGLLGLAWVRRFAKP